MESDNPRPDQLQAIAEKAVDTHCPQRASILIHELMHTSMRDLMGNNVVKTPFDIERTAGEIGRAVEKVIEAQETSGFIPATELEGAVVDVIRAEVLKRMPSGKMPHDDFFENVSAGQEPPLTQRSNLFPAQRSGPLGGKALL